MKFVAAGSLRRTLIALRRKEIYGSRVGLKAQVQNGRLVVDEPTGLPEGTVIDLVVADVATKMSSQELRELNVHLEKSWAEAEAGHLIPAEDVLQELRGRRKTPK